MPLRREPAVLILSRQALPTLDRTVLAPASGVVQGAYVLVDADSGDARRDPDRHRVRGRPGAQRPATSSPARASAVRVVSMPCWELFDRQPLEYRDQVLPPAGRARVAIEQASTLGWDRYVGDAGAIVGMHTFGASAPLKMLQQKFGFTPDAVSRIARERIAAVRGNSEETQMRATKELHELGQSIWLDNITRQMLDSGQLQTYIRDYSVTGLTSNPSIFDKAIASGAYDDAIQKKATGGIRREDLFFDLAIEDLRRAADAFLPIHERSAGLDGWVSLEVSPLLAYDTDKTVSVAKELHDRAARPNLLIKIPGTREGLPAIEQAIAAGVPVNVTLLFSDAHYRAAAEAFMRGIERRIDAEQEPVVGSVASVFMSRWDVAVQDQVPEKLKNRLALAVGLKIYRAYRELMDSARWQRLENAGARMQRLLWASTSTKDPAAPDDLYLQALGAPFTVNTVPEATLRAYYDHGHAPSAMPADGGDSDATLAEFAAAGVDVDALAAKLQTEGARGFVDSWNDLMAHIDQQTSALGVATAAEAS